MKNAKRFFSPMLWREPVHHQTDCYFCLCKTTGYNAKSKKVAEYPNVQSVTFPVPITQNEINLNNHRESDNFEGPESEIQLSRHDEAQEGPSNFQDMDEVESKVSDEDVLQKDTFNQNELSDLIRDLGLSKKNAELLASRLQEKKCLTSNTKVTFYRNRDVPFRKFFSRENNLVYCNNVEGLINEFIILFTMRMNGVFLLTRPQEV